MLSSSLLVIFTLPGRAISAELLVAAASDISRLEKPVTQEFGERVRFVFGSSGMLARQIENGAPYDVYLSANEKFVQDLAAQGKIEAKTVRVYALGRLALWSKSGRFRSIEEVRTARRVSMANPAHAPYGIAARQALEKMEAWPEVQNRVVYAENVRQALQFAESGNVDVCLTAWSLVFDRGGVLVSQALHAPIRQGAGVVSSSANKALAAKFLDFLSGETGRALLSRYGLFPPD